MPVITLVDIKGYRHFVLVKGAQAGRVFVADPALGHRVVFERDFVKGWNGIVLAVLDDQPMAADSPLRSDDGSLALRQRLNTLDRATLPAPVVEFGLVGTTMHMVDERAPVAEIYALQTVYERIVDLYFERLG